MDAAAVVTNAKGGGVEYLWHSGDTAKVGVYSAEFRATLPTGEVLTHPRYGVIRVLVQEHLQPAVY